MKRLLLSLLLFVQSALANEAESFYEIQIGGSILNLPTPKGMTRITPEMNDAYLFFERMNAQDSSNYYYADYLDLEALRQGKDKHCSISTSKKIMNHRLSKKEAQTIKAFFSTEIEALLKSENFQKEVYNIQQKQIDANADTIGAKLMGVKLIAFEPFFEDEITAFNIFKKSITTKELDKSQTEYKLNAGGMFILQGKVLNMNCSTSVDKQDEQWAKETVLDWKTKIQQANPQSFFDSTWQTFIELIKESWWFRFFFILLILAVAKRIFMRKRNLN